MPANMIVLDCDVASTLAKIGRLNLLKQVFPQSAVYMTPFVYEELLRAKGIGFSFPDDVFRSIPVIALRDEELKDFQMFSQNKRIHVGEAEGLVIAERRKAMFVTNDSVVIRFCKEKGILVMNLKDILVLAVRKNVVAKKEVIDILKEIESKDNTRIKGKQEILKPFDEKQ